ncbi:MAG: hypothetical protein ACOYMF_11230 [Bacteroidales bacterium]
MENQPVNTIGYKVTIGILLVVIAIMAWMLLNTRTTVVTLVKEKDLQRTELQTELDSLINEHARVKTSYGKLSDSLLQKDSIIMANAAEIKKLLGTQYEYYKVKKKLELLRKISQGYVHQIDSLFTVNTALKEENTQIRGNYQREQTKNEELSKDKVLLTDKINSAAVLKAYKITVLTLKTKSGDKERATDKASRVDKIKICFTLSENKLVSTGSRSVYLRIARPDKLILTHGRSDEYSIKIQGESLQYSTMQSVNYDGTAMDLCPFYNIYSKDVLMKGTYLVSVYADGREIGQTSFVLK